jgi:hypothetical protein
MPSGNEIVDREKVQSTQICKKKGIWRLRGHSNPKTFLKFYSVAESGAKRKQNGEVCDADKFELTQVAEQLFIGKSSMYFKLQKESWQTDIAVTFSECDKVREDVDNIVAKQWSQSLWWMQCMFDHSVAKIVDTSLLHLMRTIQKDGVIDTLFSKYKYAVQTPYGEVQDKTIAVTTRRVEHGCAQRSQSIPVAVQRALAIWTRYSCQPSPSSLLNDQDFCGRQERAGLQFLFQKDFFRTEDICGTAYVTTPEVMAEQSSIIASLQQISKRRVDNGHYSSSSIYHQAKRTLSTAQFRALDMMLCCRVSMMTGLTGTGKSQVIMWATRLMRCAVTTPTYASRNNIEQRCCSVRCVGFEVIQYLQYGFKYRKSWRMMDFLLHLNGVQDTSSYKGFYDSILQSKGRPPYTSEWEDKFKGSWEAMQSLDSLTTLVFEECGMMDQACFARCLAQAVAACPNLNRVVLVGDERQLKSVGRGNVLSDFVQCKAFRHEHLTEIRRSNAEHAVCSNQAVILRQDCTALRYDDSFVLKDSSDHVCTSFRDYTCKGGAVKWDSLPLKLIVDSFLDDQSHNQEPHIICYKNSEVDAVNKAIVAARFPDKHAFDKIVVGMKLCVQQCFSSGQTEIADSSAAAAGEDEVLMDANAGAARKIMKGDLYICTAVNKTCSLEDSESDVYHLALAPWLPGPGLIKKQISVESNKLSSVIKVGYATTGHRCQGGEMPFTYQILGGNCSYYDCDALYTNRSVIFARPEELKKVVQRRNKQRCSTLSHHLQCAFA